MEERDSVLKVFVDLGLAPVTAKVYLTLVDFGVLEISKLADLANIARPDTYRKLLKLQKLGLVEKILGRPTKYMAIPKKEALSLLLEAKTTAYNQLRKETRFLIETSDKEDKNIEFTKRSPEFILIPQGKRLTNAIKAAIGKAQLSIYDVLSWKRFSQGILNRFAEDIENAHAKNLDIRLIVEEPPENETAKNLIKFCKKNLNLQMRFISNNPSTIFAIYDQKEIMIVANPKEEFKSSPALWSNSDSLVSLGLGYFENLWQKAKL